MSSIAIVGGGIAGLTAATLLAERKLDIHLFEAADETGGAMGSLRREGYLVERGPNSIQTKNDAIDRLIAAAGLESARQYASDAAKRRYIVRGGRPVPMPSGPASFLRTPLFGTAAKLRLLREPFIPPAGAGSTESVADFVRRRLGPEFLDYAINPFVAGVYAGDPEKLALRYAFPRLHEIEQTHGSLIRGMFRLARERRSAPSAGPPGRMFSFAEGLGQLPATLARRLGAAVHTGVRVQRLSRQEGRWRLEASTPEPAADRPFDAVVLALPAHQLSDLLGRSGVAQLEGTRLYHPPVSVLALGYRRNDIAHPLDGFGMLVPERERAFRTLGTLVSSTLFPNRAPEGHVLLTTFVGGARHPELAGLPTDDLLRLVHQDLTPLLGARADPVFTHHTCWPQAIPQYEAGFGAFQASLDAVEAQHAGLYFAGNYRKGISVGDTIAQAESLALRIAEAYAARRAGVTT